MAVRLNITMDAELYRRLKNELPPKGISAFIGAAVKAKLLPDRKTNVSSLFPGEALVSVGGKRGRVMGDQVRSVDKRRLKGRLGTLSREELREVDLALRVTLDLA